MSDPVSASVRDFKAAASRMEGCIEQTKKHNTAIELETDLKAGEAAEKVLKEKYEAMLKLATDNVNFSPYVERFTKVENTWSIAKQQAVDTILRLRKELK